MLPSLIIHNSFPFYYISLLNCFTLSFSMLYIFFRTLNMILNHEQWKFILWWDIKNEWESETKIRKKKSRLNWDYVEIYQPSKKNKMWTVSFSSSQHFIFFCYSFVYSFLYSERLSIKQGKSKASFWYTCAAKVINYRISFSYSHILIMNLQTGPSWCRWWCARCWKKKCI